jgi:hypothetical protein
MEGRSDMESVELEQIADSYATRATREHRAFKSLESSDGNEFEYGDQALIDIMQSVTNVIMYANSDLWSFRVPVSVALNA